MYQQPNPHSPYGQPTNPQQPYGQPQQWQPGSAQSHPGVYPPAGPPPQPYPVGGQGFQAGPPPPLPPPARNRHGGVIAVVIVLALLVVGGGAGTWWYLSDRGGDSPGEPQAEGLVVEDAESGISYTLPEGWEKFPSEDLIDAFTSSASYTTETGSASVFAFSSEAITDEEMSMSTSTIAGENSEYFYPYAEDRQILISEPIEVDGQEAYRFTWQVSNADEEPMYGHLLHILTDDNRSVFLMGIVQPDDDSLRTEIDAVISGATLL